MSALTRLGIDPSTLVIPQNYSEGQEQTKSTFGYKWSRRDTYESTPFQETKRNWLIERYCANVPSRVDEWLSGDRKIILDAGCGACFSAVLLFGEHLKNHDYLGVDISTAMQVAKQRFKERGYPGDFLQASLMDLPFIPDESIDLVFSEGVLMCTDSTQAAIKYLSTKLKKGGRFLFYVYAKKAVVREFTDDYVRQELSKLSDEDAWEALKPLTKLGIALGELDVEINVPEDIPLLGIKKGKLDLQRFFYWNICKAYYRPEFSLEEMNHINFDWFRPLNCDRHTPEEIEQYCKDASLSIEHIDIQDAGITVVAQKI
jgi:arsenite methyltransferase